MALAILWSFLLCPALVNTLFIPNYISNGEIDMVGMVLNMTAEMKIMKEKLTTMEAHEARLEALEEKHSQHVVFAALIGQDKQDLPPEGYAIKFDYVISNTGGGYNPHTGVFHTPVAGTYMFSLQIMVVERGEYDFILKAEGVTKLTVIAVDDAGYHESSGTAMFHLNKGDEAVIEMGYTGCKSNCKVRARGYTQFAGVLLNAD